MEFLRCTMPEFAVLGKEGSTQDARKNWIQQLWNQFNEQAAEISHIALRDEQGNLAGFWGAMTNFGRTFQPWEKNLTQGYYLAGVQIPVEAEAPQGWIKWIIPAFDYLYARVEGDVFEALQQGLAEVERQGLTLAGAIQEFYCPQENGALYLFYPVRRQS